MTGDTTPQDLAREINDYLAEGWSGPRDRALLERAAGLLCSSPVQPKDEDGSLRSVPPAASSVPTGVDLQRCYRHVSNALFHDDRLWFTFTDRYKELGGPMQAREAAAGLAIDSLEHSGLLRPVLDYDELVEWVSRLEVTVKPVNGVVAVMAESMADAIAEFLRLNGVEVSRG